MRTSLSLIASLVLALGAPIGVAGQEREVVPDLTVPAEAEPFVGTEECEMTYFDPSESIEGVSYLVEHFSCTTETTDPRATGTEELDVFSRLGPRPLPWVAYGEFSTDEGSWRGRGEGMVDPQGRSPFGTSGRPFNYGEMTYVGEGAYDGLVMHYYFAGGDDLTGVAGWIAPIDD